MKPIILSDQSTNLNNENIFIVTNEKSSLGQIAYSLDLISNGGKDIIYLSSHELFDKISKLANNIVSMHNKNNAIVIDIDSSIISKEELNKLETIYKQYVDVFGVDIGFVNYLLRQV